MQTLRVKKCCLRYGMLLVLSLSLISNVFGTTVFASSRESLLKQSSAAITTPPIILQSGSIGNSIIYTNNTSAKVSVAAPVSGDGWGPWSDELLVNCGFEMGDLTGWTAMGPAAASVGVFSATSGGDSYTQKNLRIGNYGVCTRDTPGTNDDSGVWQNVSLTAYAYAVDCGNAVINASGWLYPSEWTWDDCALIVRFYNSTGGFIYAWNTTGEYGSGTAYYPKAWMLGSGYSHFTQGQLKQFGCYNYTIPVGTRTVGIQLGMGEHKDVNFCGGQADEASIRIRTKNLPTYYPSSYNASYGTYVSGTVPPSVQTVDSDYLVVRSAPSGTTTVNYNPFGYTLAGATTWISGDISNLTSNDGVYMAFRSYASQASAQTLYAHQETTTVGGQTYYLNKLTSADTVGTSPSAPMTSTGRQLMGRFLYPLTGVSSIPSSTWTTYYRASQTTGAISFDAASSGSTNEGTSFSWSHTTGSSSNRIMIVGISIRTTTVSVSSITYGAQSLTFIRADTHASATIRSELWYLIAPASGLGTVTVNLSGTSKATGGSCTYSDVDQTSPIDVNVGSTGTSLSPSQGVTVNTGNAWLLGHIAISASWPNVQSEGAGQTQRWDVVTGQGSGSSRNRGHGSNKGPVGIGSQTMSWTLAASGDWAVSVVALKSAFSAVGHADVTILIRQSDGTIRQTIATAVASSGNLPTTATTLSGTYSWVNYDVVAQSDYLEIDYYANVATASSAVTAYLRIDDNTLSTIDQTRTSNVILPSEFTCEVEFTGSCNTENWYQLVLTVDSAWTTGSVAVTVQLYNYTSGSYPASGSGYDSYTSNATPNTDETRTQTITDDAMSFRNASGNWKAKVKGVKTTTTQFDYKADWVEFKPSYRNEYTASTEFLFSSLTTNTPTQLNFTVVSEHSIANVNVTIQLWNYSSSAYVTSGEGYANYMSATANETQLLNVNTNPALYISNNSAKIRITSANATTIQFQQRTNQIKLVYGYSSSPDYDYVLRIVNQITSNSTIDFKVYANSNVARLSNMTIGFHDGISSDQIVINNGNITQSQGASYNLPAGIGSTIYVKINNLQATATGTSYLYMYLKALISNTNTYVLYNVTFEIT